MGVVQMHTRGLVFAHGQWHQNTAICGLAPMCSYQGFGISPLFFAHITLLDLTVNSEKSSLIQKQTTHFISMGLDSLSMLATWHSKVW